MPRVKRVAPGAEWNELSTTAADWKAADPGLLAAMLGQLHIVRAFEETVLDLAGAGLVHGRRTPASGRRAARSARSSGCARPTLSTARTAGTISSWPRPSPT